jgi:uncharacterized protein (TIGR02246 family)
MSHKTIRSIGVTLSFCVLALLLFACQPIQPQSALAQEQIGYQVIDGAGPITAADPDVAAAEAEFRAAAIAKEEAYYSGDVDHYLTFYADDVISVTPGSPEVVGKAALEEGLRPFFEGYDVNGTLTIKKFWVYGDHAFRWAEWEETATPKDGGTPEHYIGRCLLNWEKTDGEWKVVSEFTNFLEDPAPIE